MTLEAVVLGGLVVVVAAFGFAMAYAGRVPTTRSRPDRDHHDGGPGVLVSDATPGVGIGGPGDGGDGGAGDGRGDGGGGDGGGGGD